MRAVSFTPRLVFRSKHVQAIAFLLRRFASDHACCLPHSAKQIGLRYVTFLFPRGSESPLERSHVLIRLSRFAGSLWDCAFLAGDSDGVRRDAENGGGNSECGMRNSELGYGAVLRGRVRFYATPLALPRFPRGVRWGSAPQTAPRRPVSLDSLHLIRGNVRFTRGRTCGYIVALRKSRNNLYPRHAAPTPAAPG